MFTYIGQYNTNKEMKDLYNLKNELYLAKN